MNLVVLSNSISSFVPVKIICLVYKFFSQFIMKNNLVSEFKEYLDKIFQNIVQESVLQIVDIENYDNVLFDII